MYGVIIIDFIDLYTMPIWELENPLKEKFVALKVITGYQYDNTNLCVSGNYGDWFAVNLYRNSCSRDSIRHKELKRKFGDNVEIDKTYRITFWDYRGVQTIYATEFVIKDYNEPIPSDILKKINMELINYSNGMIKCSDCNKNIKQSQIGGRYFAGSYCINCWIGKTGKYKDKGGWEEIEAKETYE